MTTRHWTTPVVRGRRFEAVIRRAPRDQGGRCGRPSGTELTNADSREGRAGSSMQVSARGGERFVPPDIRHRNALALYDEVCAGAGHLRARTTQSSLKRNGAGRTAFGIA
jgi:hypothetical protein